MSIDSFDCQRTLLMIIINIDHCNQLLSVPTMSDLVLSVQHCRQQYNWDCGITCLRMLVDHYQLDHAVFEQLLCAHDCNQSTWTIDLLHLLHQLGVRAVLHTITFGCSTNYDSLPYYQQFIVQDRERVNRLFDKESCNIRVGSLDWTNLRQHLIDNRRPCLVLVDANQLQCSTCSRTIVDRFLDRVFPNVLSTYQGHYILIIGYETVDNNEYVHYVDPAKTEHVCTTYQENFDRARKAFGTDEDIICCYERSINA
jgi:hypothetical protein